jgi:zinc transporter, ZIP family
VVEAFFWGAIGAAALLIGALIAYFLNPSRQVIAVVMAIGTGLLIGSVSFELVDDALENQAVAGVAAMVLLGALVFTAGNWLLDRYGGATRKDPTGAQSDASPLAIVGIGVGRHSGVIRTGSDRSPGRCQSGTPSWHRALQPARGHVVL